MLKWRRSLKRQSIKIFYLWIFHRWIPPKTLTWYLKDFSNMASTSMRYSQVLIDSPLLFTVESQYSPHCLLRESCDSLNRLSGESQFVRTICMKSRLSFNMESRYSPYCLLWRVTTPRPIYSGESLLTAKSYFQKHWRTPPSFKGTMMQKIHYHVENCSSRTF